LQRYKTGLEPKWSDSLKLNNKRHQTLSLNRSFRLSSSGN
jgi:hypothetical protein